MVAIRDGRTSTETVRRTPSEGQEDGELTHEEFVVMDAAGRIQIPRDYLEKLGMGRRVRVEMEDGRIVVKPVDGAAARHNGPANVARAASEASVDAPAGEATKPETAKKGRWPWRR